MLTNDSIRFAGRGLLLGDLVVLALGTVAGFATHDTLDSGLARMLATFLPLCAGWLLVGPWLGVYDPTLSRTAQGLWRVPYAMLLAAPLAGVLRAAWLGSAALPVFVTVLAGVNGLALLVWRALYVLSRRRGTAHG